MNYKIWYYRKEAFLWFLRKTKPVRQWLYDLLIEDLVYASTENQYEGLIGTDLEDLEQRVEDLDVSLNDAASSDDLRDLEQRVETIEGDSELDDRVTEIEDVLARNSTSAIVKRHTGV